MVTASNTQRKRTVERGPCLYHYLGAWNESQTGEVTQSIGILEQNAGDSSAGAGWNVREQAPLLNGHEALP